MSVRRPLEGAYPGSRRTPPQATGRGLTPTDTQRARCLAFARAWHAGDAGGIVALTCDGATWVDPIGRRAVPRGELHGYLRLLFVLTGPIRFEPDAATCAADGSVAVPGWTEDLAALALAGHDVMDAPPCTPITLTLRLAPDGIAGIEWRFDEAGSEGR